MAVKKVAPQTVKFVEAVGCTDDCSTTLVINNGIDLPCKEWDNIDSALLRERMLVDNQLFASGFVRRIERSSLGDSLRIKKRGIDVGSIRTQDSGAPAVNECDTVFDSITMKDFEKTFYVVNTTKNLQICVKDFIGLQWQDLIGGQMSDYAADEFAGSDLADIIISGIIEKYSEFTPKFMLLASGGGSGEDMHGDDGILAKAYYASKGQYFHTIQYDVSEVKTDYPNVTINAIVGGSKYDTAPSAFASADLYLLDFVDWLNGLKEKRNPLFNATIDVSEGTIYVASTIATRIIDLKIVLNDGTLVDWGCEPKAGNVLVFTELQRAMLINDVPLLFQYETIDSSNFAEKFKEYKKNFKTYLHNNGFTDVIESDVMIGIDPLLMFEREAQTQDAFISGNLQADFMDKVGLQISQFKPLNALTDTGLFFMTVAGNLLLLDDGSNYLNEITNMGRIKFSEACDTNGMVNIMGGAPPIGSEIEHYGLFASNLEDSWFVQDNGLDDREPYQSTLANLPCFDDNVKKHCLIESQCVLNSNVETVSSYDGGADETTILVTIGTNTPVGTTLVYDVNWALSDGTSMQGVNTASFIITLPGDQTASGLSLTVTGQVTATIGPDSQCTTYLSYSERYGEGTGLTLCVGTIVHDQSGDLISDSLNVVYTIDGVISTIPLIDSALDLNQVPDYPAIELEMEAILPGTSVTISKLVDDVTILVEDLPSFLIDVKVLSDNTANETLPLVIDC